MRVIVADDEFFARKALVKRIGNFQKKLKSARRQKTADKLWSF